MPYYKSPTKDIQDDLDKKMIKYHNLLTSHTPIPTNKGNKHNSNSISFDTYNNKSVYIDSIPKKQEIILLRME